MGLTHFETNNHVALITMNHPPVNGLGYDLRVAIIDGIRQAVENPNIQAIIITGSEKSFSGGADIKEFGTVKAITEPHLQSVIRVIENSPKPVIAAIQGVCMGGGMELALGCHYRVASPNASVALPEIKLGLIPGAGGTQRMPRVIGVEKALNFILSGDPVPAIAFKGTPLLDAIFETDFIPSAIQFAEQVIAEKKPLKKIRDIRIQYPEHEAFLQFSRNTVKTVAAPYPAALKVIDAISAAITLTFEQGIAKEREYFLELMNTSVSRAMRYAFFAQRNTSKVADIPSDTPLRDIKHVGIIGAGTMGGGIAMNFVNVGIPVTIVESSQEKLAKGLGIIQANYESSVKKGKLTPEKLQQRMSLIQPSLYYQDLSQVDLVIEAVFEDIGVKKEVFKKLDSIVKPGAILASNTSTLDVNQIAQFTSRPQDVIGMHFFSPANVMQLVEVIRGDLTSKDVIATVMKLSQKLKKTPVICRVCDGFIGNRMVEQYLRMAGFLLEQGATPLQIDKALENFGMVMGPFRMSDLAGNDIGWAIRKRRVIEQPEVKYSAFADQICEAGRFGQKTGKGWYLYEKGNRKPIPDPELEQLLVEFRAKKGIQARKISSEEIVQYCIFALINEGARILEEGIAQRASDIDIVYLTGYGFPVYRGGPLKYADEIGLFQVIQVCLKFYESSKDPFWLPAKLLQDSLTQMKTLTGS
ncbi:fatty acid degradation protein [Polynucleobacter sp. SHI8]|uniref:3-hydroxyacyl-CoA dehydrogenase NAD-binding domain-containing protein n=1 Tax=unclassified Polynucleobacter TaxID=2640945 RepID=UPI0024936625|nr:MULTISPECIES: 3-hydroxyacyl-CoA dehydrogenase NAD-binding domain-containing protein [unclassified Polynucleobacter]BDW11125.1 fatty acid degradation protein [Polynucleobacter sp. SHI2]BDW13571.1 fatty acid degradation protein [Polynucleobacter sp. SHI8]